MLGQLPQDELGPMLKALMVEPPSDRDMANSLIQGIRFNQGVEGTLRGELLQQLLGGLGEELLNDGLVRSMLDSAISSVAGSMLRRDAVNYLATGAGGDFRLTFNDNTNQRLVQQSTYANGQWNPPLPQHLQGEAGDVIMKNIRERQNLLSALERFQFS